MTSKYKTEVTLQRYKDVYIKTIRDAFGENRYDVWGVQQKKWWIFEYDVKILLYSSRYIESAVRHANDWMANGRHVHNLVRE